MSHYIGTYGTALEGEAGRTLEDGTYDPTYAVELDEGARLWYTVRGSEPQAFVAEHGALSDCECRTYQGACPTCPYAEPCGEFDPEEVLDMSTFAADAQAAADEFVADMARIDEEQGFDAYGVMAVTTADDDGFDPYDTREW